MITDEFLIRQCWEIAKNSVKNNEGPFGSVLVKNNKVISFSGNEVKKNKDLTLHAEILAMKKGQKLLGSLDLRDCTIYSICEPCPMCSFVIRETKIKRVVYSLKSPYMGGYSKWNILEDKDLCKFSNVYSKPPQITKGILEKDIMKFYQQIHWENMII